MFFLLHFLGYSQIKKNALYVEVFGNGSTLLSLNYERMFEVNKEKNTRVAIRCGYTLGKNYFDQSPTNIIITEINCLIGKKKHLIEVGGGYTGFFGTSKLDTSVIKEGFRTNYNYYFTLRVGYRFIDKEKLVVRFAPLITLGPAKPEEKQMNFGFTFGASIGILFDLFGKGTDKKPLEESP